MIKSDENNPHIMSDKINNEIDLRELFKVLWSGAPLIILLTSAVAIASIVYALQLTNYYKSESILLVRDNAQSQGMFSQLSGGVSSMLGVNLPTTGDKKAMEAMELIQSRNFVNHLIGFEGVLPSIMAAQSYDSFSKELVFNSEVYNSKSKTWTREPNANGIVEPTYLEAHRAYGNGLLSILQDKKTGFIRIHVEHISPVFASEFLQLVIREANTLLRNRDMKESDQALQYLKSELAKTSYVEIRESINSLIEAQLETQMLAKINEEYSLAIIDPPFIPENKSKPVRSIIVIVSTAFGGFFSVMLVLVRHFFFRRKQEA
jgi:uncharacterized protein involved in exopolysaccharide biosynthesis